MNKDYPSELLSSAVEAIGSLPGVGRRSALRLALHLLKQPAENVHHFTESIAKMRDEVRYCSVCKMISDSDVCSICSDHKRNHNIICAVESIRDVMSIENTGQYHGVYHVLGGIISPIDGVGPGDLTIDSLISRLETLSLENSSEIELILALGGDVEGETTSYYIYRRVEKLGIKVTAPARGLGFGDDIEYADSLTLGRSILSRQPFR